MKKTKRKKSTVALPTKRKRFGGLFFRRWIMVLTVSVIICFLVKDKIVREAFDYEKHSYEYARDAILGTINKGPQYDESNEFYYNRIKFIMTQMQDMGTASVLYNAETGEISVGCEEQIIFNKKTEDDSYLKYACATKDIEGWDEYRKELLQYKNGNDSLIEAIDMKYIYVDGASFLPGEFTVTGMLNDINTGENEIVMTKTFSEPENLSSDYVKTQLTDDWIFYYAWGYSENTLSGRYWNTDSYKELQKCYQESMEEGNPVVCGEIYYGDYELCLGDASTLILPTGEEVVLITVRYYDAWVQFGKLFIIVATIVFVVGLILSFIWAKLSYAGLKVQYDMIDFRNTLMNTMAHDLKSPLMSISGYAENLRDNINTDKHQHYSDAILENVQYMNHMVESILTFSKTEKADISKKKESISIEPLIVECAKKYDLQIKEKSLSLDVEGEASLNINASLFIQAIDNLIGNAVKYASEDSSIKVILEENTITVTNVCDENIDVDVDKLCQPFVVGNMNRSDKLGNGLGLAIANNICKLHKFCLEIKYEDNIFIAKISK